MNYDKWKPKKWETNVSNIKYLFFESLHDTESELIITLSNKDDKHFKIIFNDYPAYRNVQEEYKQILWATSDQRKWGFGNTWLIENSDWLEFFKKEEPLIAISNDTFYHYIIITQSAVIEIISSDIEPKAIVVL